MESPAFFAEVKRRATRQCSAADPLAEARRFLEASGLTGEGQMVRKSVEALAASSGAFDEADVHRLGSETLALVSALADARAKGRYPDSEWRAAATAGQ